MDASKNELYVTGSIVVSTRADDYGGNVVRVPAGNKASSPALRPTLSPMERIQDGKVGRDVMLLLSCVLSGGYECVEL